MRGLDDDWMVMARPVPVAQQLDRGRNAIAKLGAQFAVDAQTPFAMVHRRDKGRQKKGVGIRLEIAGVTGFGFEKEFAPRTVTVFPGHDRGCAHMTVGCGLVQIRYLHGSVAIPER